MSKGIIQECYPYHHRKKGSFGEKMARGDGGVNRGQICDWVFGCMYIDLVSGGGGAQTPQ